ncbi:MAG TPA: helix-turn-helix domain-containing protein [Nitrososphaerales archaeon]|nr:helix-turn-helix domain-containing protein [Nitrososphaerales archaeon]
MDERAQRLLVQYGLSERESLVYLSLLANGKQSAGEIAKAVQIRRMEAYRIIKRLADSAIVEAAPGNPVKYTAVPIEQVVAMMMDRQMKKLDEMEKGRAEVVSLGKMMALQPASERDEYSFKMVQGREQIYGQVLRMVAGSQSNLDMVLTRNDLMQLHILGLAESLRDAKKRGVKARVISVCDHQTTEASEAVMRAAELRHSEDFVKSRIVVSDGVQVLVSLVLDDVAGRKNDRDVAIWTNSGDYAGTMLPMFGKAFAGSLDARERLRELKTGRRAGERAKAMIDIVKASLPLEGWGVEVPGRLRGISGADYDVSVLLDLGGKRFAVDVVMGNDEASARDEMIAAIMKGIEIKSPRLVVIGSPFSGDDLQRLANLVGVVLIDGADPVAAVAKLRKVVSG